MKVNFMQSLIAIVCDLQRHLLNVNMKTDDGDVGGDSSSVQKEQTTVLQWYDTWCDHDRTLFINRILPALDQRQLYFTVGELTRRQYRDFVADLPQKLAIKVGYMS